MAKKANQHGTERARGRRVVNELRGSKIGSGGRDGSGGGHIEKGSL